MKWKDNLIYEFINQIISLKWILKPETLWWLSRRGKVFSFPCVEKLYFHNVVLAKTVEHACAVSASATCRTHRFLGSGRELLPSGGSSSVLNSRGSERSCLPPGAQPVTARRRPPRTGALSSVLTDTKRGAKGVIPGLNLGPFLPSIQTLTPGSSVTLWTWSLGSEKRGVDLWVVFLCILKPLSGEAQQKAKYPLSFGRSCGDDPACAVTLCNSNHF